MIQFGGYGSVDSQRDGLAAVGECDRIFREACSAFGRRDMAEHERLRQEFYRWAAIHQRASSGRAVQ